MRELACLRLLHERLPHKTLQHVKVFEFLFKKGYYFTAEEVAKESQIPKKLALSILKELSEKRLIEKEGCLYRCNGTAIEEIVALT